MEGKTSVSLIPIELTLNVKIYNAQKRLVEELISVTLIQIVSLYSTLSAKVMRAFLSLEMPTMNVVFGLGVEEIRI